MDVVYSASALGAFSDSMIYIGIFFILGLGNLLLVLLTRKPRRKRKAGDVAMVVLGVFLLFVGALMTVVTFNSYRNGDKTVQVRALEKREVTVKCGRYYCTEYDLETTDGVKRYVFGLEKDTWGKMQVDACYQFTYYPLKPLLAGFLQQEPSMYETTGYITLIRNTGC
ncbi:MAG TPA: hypothetical protein PK152_17720 [Anaerolineales bacterium]|nr:hypothetical protein [Anaerolineae bacterium]HRJ57116.1 hypothetical protein [Anaerolineales bacterium]HRK90971.1 hypothetical protein [Anaerolineales bacterium]